MASQSFFETCKNQIEKFKKLNVGELISLFKWPYRVMAIPCVFALISLFVSPHFSLEAAEPVYVALGVIAVMIVTIVLFCAEGFKEGLSLRGMVLLRESGIKELTICFFIFIACVPFLSHPKESEVQLIPITTVMMVSDSQSSISSSHISNVSNDGGGDWFLNAADNFLLLLGVLFFSGWTAWSFFKLVKVLTNQDAFGEGLSGLLRELALKEHQIREVFFWNEKFSREFIKSIRDDDLVFFNYLKFFIDYPKSKAINDRTTRWITRPILDGLVTAINKNNDRYFGILLDVVQEVFLKEKQLVAHFPEGIYEKVQQFPVIN